MSVLWRDIFSVEIDNPDLKEKVEGFLDYFQDAEFTYDRQDPNTGEITSQTLKGQDILRGIADKLNYYKELGLTDVLSDPSIDERIGIPQTAIQGASIMSNGLFTIRDHNMDFTGGAETGSYTFSFGLPGIDGLIETGIVLGTDYLQGAKYNGTDGKTHPVTVEGVLANELAHMHLGAEAESASIFLESVVTTVNGGVQREPGNSYIEFEKNGNDGFQTLRTYKAQDNTVESDLSDETIKPKSQLPEIKN